MKVDIVNLSLNKLIVDPSFVPEVVRSNRATKSDEDLVLDYLRLNEDLNFMDLIRAFVEDGKFYVVSNYSCYEAHKRFYSQEPSKEVTCLIFSETSRDQIKIYSERIGELTNRNVHTHIDRIVSIKSMLLADPKLSYDDFKRFRNLIGKSQSKDAKKLERDYKIAKSDYFYTAIMGHEKVDPGNLFYNPDKATYTYEFCASKILPIIGDNYQAEALFHTNLQKYVLECKARPHERDFDHKPIYKWKGIFSKEAVINIAKNAISQTGSSLLVDTNVADFDWRYELINGSLRIPSTSIQSDNVEPKNLKIVVELCYRASQLQKALMAVLDQFRPYSHGDTTKIRMREGNLFSNGRSDILHNAERYFDFVRKTKYLFYSNKLRLWRSIGLTSDHFGFINGRPYTTNTCKIAHTKFSHWFENDFLSVQCAKLPLTKPSDHPFYLYYRLIQEILDKMAKTEALEGASNGVRYDKFTVEIFRRLFNLLDETDRRKNESVKEMSDFLGSSIDNLVIKAIETGKVPSDVKQP